LGTDLNTPLGQNRRPEPQGGKKTVLSAGRVLAGLGIIALAGISTWAVLAPSGLRQTEKPQETAEVTPEATPDKMAGGAKPDDTGSKPTPLPTSGALSGANVEKTLTEDGSIITKFSPGQRSGDGPALIQVERTRGQDPRMAALPNDALLEDAPEGRLPIVGANGERPMDQYARPWSGARGIRIALVVGGLGLSQTGTQKAIRDLPEEVTLGFAATGNSLQRWMQEARRDGHEILLQVPMEPFDYPDNNPGPHTLRTGLDAQKNLKELHYSLAQITNYTGIMNFLGGQFLSNADALEPVMRDLAKRGLLFLDDGTSAQSLTGTLADTIGVPHGFADLVVDGQLERIAILRKLDELERIARRNGTAIGVASAFDESVGAVSQWMDEAGTRGIEFVGVSALVKDPQQQ
jgi:polysaccharide deacetylase 2 family uncharacterized protein YibQ